jgi:hypothetical protein
MLSVLIVTRRRDFDLTMKLDEKLRLAPVVGTITTAAEDEHHWMLSLQLGELSAFRGMLR